MRRATATCGLLMSLAFALPACGSDDSAGDEATLPTVATTPAESTVEQTAPATTSAPTTVSVTTEETVASAPTTSNAPEIEPILVLRGDGVGMFDFGSPQDAVIAGLTDQFGAPKSDSGPPQNMVTSGLTGCAVQSEWAAGFGGSLVVGFADQGAGPVLTSWSAFHNFHGIGDAPTPFATIDGLWIGVELADVEGLYGERFHPRPATGWLWPTTNPVAMVESSGGTIAVIDLFQDGHADMLTAGVGCGPTGILPEPLGEYPRGLRYMSGLSVAPDGTAFDTLVDASTGEPIGWRSFGGTCIEVCAAVIDVVGEADAAAPTALWASRPVESRDGKTVWVVTDVRSIPPELDVWGNWDCTSSFALIDASGAIAVAFSLDVMTGKFVDLAPDKAQCVEIMGD
jgi:hypothetical protein